MDIQIKPKAIKPNLPAIKPPMSRRKKKLLAISGAVIVCLGILTGGYFLFKKTVAVVTNTVNPTPTATPVTKASLLTGVQLASDIATREPVAAMIENTTDARPQSGLINADIVYETVAEGGITRYMGVFSSDLPEKAGPIRSSRSYYLDWLGEYDGFYVHAGGSPTALAKIGEYKVKDYPHNSTSAFWREPQAGVASEHTLYSNLKTVFTNGLKNGWPSTNDKIVSWKFAANDGTAATVNTINIPFSTATYAVKWTYDPSTNTYLRDLNGAAHKDKVTGKQITATDVIVEETSYSGNGVYSGTSKTAEGNLKTTGSGKATIYRGGQKIEGTWNKASRTDRTKFLDSTGTEITLNPGKIWVEVTPQYSGMTSS